MGTTNQIIADGLQGKNNQIIEDAQKIKIKILKQNWGVDMNDFIQCIYCITNNINNKKYIGSTTNYDIRKKNHIYKLNSGKHESSSLQEDCNIYGLECFEFKILEMVEQKADLIEREVFFTNKYESYNFEKGYNLKIGDNYTDKLKKEISKRMIGEKNPFYKKKHTEEAKEKIRKSKIGLTLTDKQKDALELGRGSSYFTDETYKRLREMNCGEKSATSKLTEKDVIEILNMVKEKISYEEIKNNYNISIAQISRIKSGKRWKYLKEKRGDLYE